MINEKASLLLEKVIKEKYSNIRLDNKVFSDEDFYYDFIDVKWLMDEGIEFVEKHKKKSRANARDFFIGKTDD